MAQTPSEEKPIMHTFKARPRGTNSALKESLPYISLMISIIAIIASIYSYSFALSHSKTTYVYINNTNSIKPGITQTILSGYNISGSLITPPVSLAIAPIITSNQSFGDRLTNINQPLNSSELSIINNAPDSYYEIAGEMYLNHTLTNEVGAQSTKVSSFMLNGKPSIIYLGSITCIFCGENRWAMALALSRFGNFSNLFKGYSSIGDSDVPTVYWSPAHYNSSTVDLGSFYNSKYINFIAIEDTSPITGGFSLQPLQVIQSEVNASGNLAYSDAYNYVMQLNNFQGTPYTIWGNYNIGGADAVDFGNQTPTSTNPTLQLTYMTHNDVLNQLAAPKGQFAWSEYAAADLYIAMTCASLNNTAPICSLPAIKGIEAANGYTG